jgi:hypothetical protein
MLPLLAAAAGAKMLGPLVGGIMQNNDITKGMNAFRENVQQGTGVLKAGQAGANAAFDPYQKTGAAGTQGELSAVQNRTMAPQPTATNTSAGGVEQWLNPMATWQQNQASKAGSAAGIATGATGGGMQRAIANNAGKMAAGNWNDAYNQMLQANAQNFGQGQAQFENKTNFDQSQIGNYGALAQRGLSAVGANQGLQAGYNEGVSNNFGKIADNEMSAWGKKGQLMNDMWTGGANNASGLLSLL